MTRYSIIHKDGTETAYVWCDKTKQMIVDTRMKAIIYSNRNQECERAQSFLESCHLDETIVYYLDKDFTIRQFMDEFGEGSEFPQIAIGYKHIGSLKDTLHYMSEKGMFI